MEERANIIPHNLILGTLIACRGSILNKEPGLVSMSRAVPKQALEIMNLRGPLTGKGCASCWGRCESGGSGGREDVSTGPPG